MFKTGDIVGVRGTPCQRLLLGLISPASDRWHFFLIGEYLYHEGDRVIYESLADGVRIGRLSLYRGAEVEVYRISDEKVAGEIIEEASEFGRDQYDYVFFVRLVLQAVGYWIKNGFRPVPYVKFANVDDKLLTCTELVEACCRAANFPLFSPQIVATPAAFKQAALDGRISLVFKGVL